MGKFAALFLVIILLTLFITWIIAFGDAGVPRREQRKYQRLAQSKPLTMRQEQILALDAVSDYGTGLPSASYETPLLRAILTRSGRGITWNN